jgi:hypothetical protein
MPYYMAFIVHKVLLMFLAGLKHMKGHGKEPAFLTCYGSETQGKSYFHRGASPYCREVLAWQTHRL